MASRQRDQSKAAAEAVASTADVLHEILIRIPAKSLFNFRTVSRQWYDLISHPQFRREHTRRNPNPSPTGLFLDEPFRYATEYVRLGEDYCLKRTSDPPCKFPRGVKIVDSCNGLVLCSFGSYLDDPIRRFYICNPTTKGLVRVPKPVGKGVAINSIVLAFDPSMPGNYRLVCLWTNDWYPTHQTHRADVYESETGLWRPSAAFSTDDTEELPCHGVFWKGGVHWLGLERSSLVCLDFNRDSFQRTTILPPGNYWDIIYFGACQGHLYLVRADVDSNPARLVVYEMEKDHSCLLVKYSVVEETLVHSLRKCGFGHLSSIFLGNEEELIIVVSNGRKVHTYNAKAPDLFPNQVAFSINNIRRHDVVNYIESLAPV